MCQTAAAQVGTANASGGFKFSGYPREDTFSLPKGGTHYLSQGSKAQGYPGMILEDPSLMVTPRCVQPTVFWNILGPLQFVSG